MTHNIPSFINLAIKKKVLQFGEFTTKAGRKSPYFFNLGNFNDGESIRELGKYYAQIIVNSNIEFDMIFGPAYKGIPLVSSIAIALMEHNINIPYSFNRKEIKDHGEGGNIIGADPAGNVLIIDDVLSAGTAARESIKILEDLNATPKIFLVGLDRQEKGNSELSAKSEIETDFGINVSSIINLDALIEYSHTNQNFYSYVEELEQYRNSWGA